MILTEFVLINFCFRNIFTRDSDSSSESNPEDHIYEEIDSDVFVTSNDDEVAVLVVRH